MVKRHDRGSTTQGAGGGRKGRKGDAVDRG